MPANFAQLYTTEIRNLRVLKLAAINMSYLPLLFLSVVCKQLCKSKLSGFASVYKSTTARKDCLVSDLRGSWRTLVKPS